MPPDVPSHWTEDDLDEEAEAQLASVVSALLALDHGRDPDGNLIPVPIPFAPDARRAYVAWWRVNAEALAHEAGDLRASLAKMPAYVARLALILELAGATVTSRHVATVGLASVQAAITLVDWFSAEAARVIEVLDESDEDRELRTVEEWVERRGGFATVAELARSGPRLYRGKTEAAEEVLDRLVRSKRARWDDTTGMGRPTRGVQLLPRGAET
jgi:hypothetical protein